jgi:cobyrinic acid a,c-diamide synthase
MPEIKRVVVGGVSSSSGKTIISLCIEAGLISMGFDVSAFKVGPDFIDPSYHRTITKCFNLDPVMSSPEFVKFLFKKESSEFNVIEGVMGIFDGEKYKGSTSFVANLLYAPSILCINAESLGESIRGIVKGFKDELDLKGVVATKVGSQKHAELLKQALKKEKIPLLAALPKLPQLEFPSRHLGLVLADEIQNLNKKSLTEIFFKFFDVKAILKIFESSAEKHIKVNKSWEEKFIRSTKNKLSGVKVGVLKLKPFSFIYPENIFMLKLMGADVIMIDESLIENSLESSIDLLLIPGGYPEIYSDYISDISKKIRHILDKSCFVIAECGGLELLSQKIIFEGREKNMLGIFDFIISIEKRLQALGWRKIQIRSNKNKKYQIKGHEFHYGKIMNPEKIQDYRRLFKVYDISGKFLSYQGFLKEKFLVSWCHLYFPSNPLAVSQIMRYFLYGQVKNK